MGSRSVYRVVKYIYKYTILSYRYKKFCKISYVGHLALGVRKTRSGKLHPHAYAFRSMQCVTIKIGASVFVNQSKQILSQKSGKEQSVCQFFWDVTPIVQTTRRHIPEDRPLQKISWSHFESPLSDRNNIIQLYSSHSSPSVNPTEVQPGTIWHSQGGCDHSGQSALTVLFHQRALGLQHLRNQSDRPPYSSSQGISKI